MRRITSAALIGYSLLVLVTSLRGEDLNWSQWRGPLSDGHAVAAGAPLTWSAANILWKTPLKGDGQSSPTLWGNRIFLTTALDGGKQRVVFCVDAHDGRVLWEQVAWTGEPEKSHVMNGWASATCATDGEVVVAFFGKGGLHAYSVEGEHLWSRDLGVFESPWGTAACPIIVGQLVIQNGDSDRNAFIEAFDRRTGKSVWRQKRPDNRGWSSPILQNHGGRELLILNGHAGVTAYDPASGEQIWFTKNSNGRGEPTVAPGAGYLYVVCGLAGDMVALRLTGSGSQPEVAWTAARRSGRDLPSPIQVGNVVIVNSMGGIASCYDSQTGQELWKDRLEGKFSSSPIVIDNHVLHQSETGETFVIQPGPKLNIVARNILPAETGELFRASLTPTKGRVYSRSNKYLYCIGTQPNS